MKQKILIAFICSVLSSMTCFAGSSKTKLHSIPCKNYAQVEAYLRYTPDCEIIISGHRGGVDVGFPENSIESFEHTLSVMPSFFEIDPRMTKDSVMVLMHDAKIDRTTNGKGYVKDYTYAELQQFNLKDRWGAVTTYKIPSVEQALRWSRGKTILNFDMKDVPREVLIPFVQRMRAMNVIYTVHTPEDAKLCIALDPDAHMSAWIADMDEFRAYEATGIPWSRFIAYVVSPVMKPENQPLYDALHRAGVRCMISTAPLQDRLATRAKRAEKFKDAVASKPDIIESDYPTEFVGMYERR